MICALVGAMWVLARKPGMQDMAEGAKLGLRDVRAMGPGTILWDGAVPGLCARRQKGEAVTFAVRYRTADGRQRWHRIGRLGAVTPDEARAEARRILGDVARGGDPAGEREAKRRAATVAELCARYLADAEAGRLLVRGGAPKRPGTLSNDKARIASHIVPLLGRMPVAAVTRQDIERMMHGIAEGATARGAQKTRARGVSAPRGGRGVATRTIGLAGAVFEYAIAKGLRADNPAHRIRKFAENRRERRLSDAEYASLGAALRAAAGRIWPPAVACLRFLALTGWRSGEALALRWQDVDMVRRVAVLPETKTGRSVRPLSHAACALLASLPRMGDGRLVFPASRGVGTMSGFKGFARRILAAGGLPRDISPHTLRHSFASVAADLGHGELTIASLLGHRLASVTARYVHGADAVLLAAADGVAQRVAELMGDAEPAGVVVAFGARA